LIKAGIIIGDGAVIGMGSVVTKNVEPYSVVAGNPAKILKMRFEYETIKLLSKSRWWEWEDNKIMDNALLFNNIEEFKKVF